eukprot:1706167-Rhodomonas_salina.1
MKASIASFPCTTRISPVLCSACTHNRQGCMRDDVRGGEREQAEESERESEREREREREGGHVLRYWKPQRRPKRSLISAS